MKEYIALKENDKKMTHLSVYTSYSLGGMNMFTYKNEPRGYSLHIQPVQRGNGFESCCPFDGVKLFLVECKRKSNKSEAVADGIAQIKKKELIEYVCKNGGYELA